MEMRTSEYPKPEVANESDLIPHCIISSQASELHQKGGRSTWDGIYHLAISATMVIALESGDPLAQRERGRGARFSGPRELKGEPLLFLPVVFAAGGAHVQSRLTHEGETQDTEALAFFLPAASGDFLKKGMFHPLGILFNGVFHSVLGAQPLLRRSTKKSRKDLKGREIPDVWRKCDPDLKEDLVLPDVHIWAGV